MIIKYIAIREKKIFFQNKIEEIYLRENPALSPGNAVTAWSGFRGSYALGEIGKRAEVVGQEAVDGIKKEMGFDVDMHLADQLLIYGALADGATEFTTSEITNHLKTNSQIIQKFIDRKIGINDNKVTIN